MNTSSSLNEMYERAGKMLSESKVIDARKLLQTLAESKFLNSEMILAHTVIFLEHNSSLIPESLKYLEMRVREYEDIDAAMYLETYYMDNLGEEASLPYVISQIRLGLVARHFTIYRMIKEGKLRSGESSNSFVYANLDAHLDIAADAGHIFAIRDRKRRDAVTTTKYIDYIFNRFVLLPFRAILIGIKNQHDARLLP